MNEFRTICARIPGNDLVAQECHNLCLAYPDPSGIALAKNLDYVERSAYLSYGLRCLVDAGSLEELIDHLNQLHLSVDRFAISLLRLQPCLNVSKMDAIRAIANTIHGAPDLHSPLHQFLLVIQSDCLWLGEILATCLHSYEVHHQKPYHTSNSLPGRLARALINLVSPPARSILDPFCGTGSILLEANAIGLSAFGCDHNPRMVGMTIRNLDYFGYAKHVLLLDAIECQQTADAIVTDLPYGRLLTEIEIDRLLPILQHLNQLAPVAIYLAEHDISSFLTEAGYRNIEVYQVRKRAGMHRFVHKAQSHTSSFCGRVGAQKRSTMAELAPKDIGREDVRTLVRRGAQLVEVLPKQDYESIHLTGAVNIPLLLLRRNTADRLKWDKPVIVYAQDGLDDRAARAAWRLASMGFTQVFRYPGGKADWLANGLPVEGTDARQLSAADLADLDVPTCERLDRIGEIKDKVRNEGWNTCVVVNRQFVVLGLIRGNDLDHANPNNTAEETMEHDPQTFRLNVPVEEMKSYFRDQPLVESVLITTSDGKLFGLLKREDLDKQEAS